MLAGVCHEVANPLSAVYSMVQILQSKRGVTPETMEKGLASIAANIARVLAITRKLGDYSRVTDAPVPIAIDDAVDSVSSLLRHTPHGDALDLAYRGAPGVQVRARTGELQQVLFNIALNSAQAVPDGGRIEIEARPGADGLLLVSIRDTGPGIAPEHLAHVFDPFFTTKAPGEGTGLGLAISYEIVHELGGTIHASNHPQGGACFELTLPIWRE
jgi:signal transduction histidine kinase